MRNLIRASVLVATLFWGAPPSFAVPGEVWDFVADFSHEFPNGAPNGAWKYGYSTTLGGEFVGHAISGGVRFGVFGYQAGPSAPLNELQTGVNRTGATISHAPPNYYVLDNEGWSQAPWPGPAPQKNIVRWTAPESADFDVDIWFGGGWAVGGATMDAHVYVNGASVLSDMLLGYAGDDQGTPEYGDKPVITYISTLTLSAGDTIDMIIGDGGSPGGDVARQKMMITQAASSMSPGDFNGNGFVDAADYVVWRKGLGTTYTQTDYDVWRAHFGQTLGSASGLGSGGAVPEPTSAVLAGLSLLGLVYTSGVRTQRRRCTSNPQRN